MRIAQCEDIEFDAARVNETRGLADRIALPRFEASPSPGQAKCKWITWEPQERAVKKESYGDIIGYRFPGVGKGWTLDMYTSLKRSY